jgi:hypothetical protein
LVVLKEGFEHGRVSKPGFSQFAAGGGARLFAVRKKLNLLYFDWISKNVGG